MKKIVIIVLAAILIIPAIDIESKQPQNIQNERKTYSGKYSFSGLYFFNNLADFKTNVRYEYIDASDGSRIYDGKFEMKDSTSRENFSINGKFKNNKQVGKWIWLATSLEKEDKGKITKKIVLTFDDTGKLNGPFELQYRNHETIVGTFKNGKISTVEKYYYYSYYDKDCGGNKIVEVRNAKFNDNLKLVGKDWYFRIKRGNKMDIRFTASYDQSGKLIMCGYRDDSDGEWEDCSGSTGTCLDPLQLRLLYELNYYIMRSTPKIKDSDVWFLKNI